jgi:hypothetical protein
MKVGYVCLCFQPKNVIMDDPIQIWAKKECRIKKYFYNDMLSFGVAKPY